MSRAPDRTTSATDLVGRSARSVMMVAMFMLPVSIAIAHGVSWAGPAELTADLSPADLSGRWTGPRHGYGALSAKAGDCGGKPCAMTYDIVRCDGGWCGIAVTDDSKCGAIGLKLTVSSEPDRPNSFDGRLELAKGSAPFVLKAWYRPGQPADAEGGQGTPPNLGMIGDTGTELLMMRRSFPFQANLSRTGDAVCTLEKATS